MKECTAFGYQSSMMDSLSLASDAGSAADLSVCCAWVAESVVGAFLLVFVVLHPLTISKRLMSMMGSREYIPLLFIN